MWMILAAAIGLLLFVLDAVWGYEAHAEVFWMKVKGVHFFLGLLSGLLLVGMAKGIGTYWLYRKENEYD